VLFLKSSDHKVLVTAAISFSGFSVLLWYSNGRALIAQSVAGTERLITVKSQNPMHKKHVPAWNTATNKQSVLMRKINYKLTCDTHGKSSSSGPLYCSSWGYVFNHVKIILCNTSCPPWVVFTTVTLKTSTPQLL